MRHWWCTSWWHEHFLFFVSCLSFTHHALPSPAVRCKLSISDFFFCSPFGHVLHYTCHPPTQNTETSQSQRRQIHRVIRSATTKAAWPCRPKTLPPCSSTRPTPESPRRPNESSPRPIIPPHPPSRAGRRPRLPLNIHIAATIAEMEGRESRSIRRAGYQEQKQNGLFTAGILTNIPLRNVPFLRCSSIGPRSKWHKMLRTRMIESSLLRNGCNAGEFGFWLPFCVSIVEGGGQWRDCLSELYVASSWWGLSQVSHRITGSEGICQLALTLGVKNADDDVTI